MRLPDGWIQTWAVMDPAKPGAEYTVVMEWKDGIPTMPVREGRPITDMYPKF